MTNFKIIKFIVYLKNTSIIKFILFSIASILTISGLIGILADKDDLHNRIQDYNIFVMFLIGVLVAPFFETILFQAIPFYFTRKFQKKTIIYVLVSALLFALAHPLNLYYFVAVFSMGCFLAFIYFVSTFRTESSILLISTVHALYNLIVLLSFWIDK